MRMVPSPSLLRHLVRQVEKTRPTLGALPSDSSTTINKSANQQYEHCSHDSSDIAGILIRPIPANSLPEVGRHEGANDAKDRC